MDAQAAKDSEEELRPAVAALRVTRPTWATREARRAHARTFRKMRWWVAGFAVATGAAGTAALMLLPGTATGFAVGSSWATCVWAVAMVVMQASGTAPKLMGGRAEDWTATELKKLRRQSWYSLHRVLLKGEDVDHVVVGPGGVFALETKWSATTWKFNDRRFEGAAAQARRNARAVRLRLSPQGQGPAVKPLVVLWGEDDSDSPRELDGGVTVVHGTDLVQWICASDDMHLESEEIRRHAAALETYASTRNAHEARRDPLTRYEEVGIGGIAGDVYLGVGSGFATLVGFAFAWLALPPLGVGSAGAAAVVGALLARRRWPRFYAAGVGVATAAGGMLALYLFVWTIIWAS